MISNTGYTGTGDTCVSGFEDTTSYTNVICTYNWYDTDDYLQWYQERLEQERLRSFWNEFVKPIPIRIILRHIDIRTRNRLFCKRTFKQNQIE